MLKHTHIVGGWAGGCELMHVWVWVRVCIKSGKGINSTGLVGSVGKQKDERALSLGLKLDSRS